MGVSPTRRAHPAIESKIRLTFDRARIGALSLAGRRTGAAGRRAAGSRGHRREYRYAWPTRLLVTVPLPAPPRPPLPRDPCLVRPHGPRPLPRPPGRVVRRLRPPARRSGRRTARRAWSTARRRCGRRCGPLWPSIWGPCSAGSGRGCGDAGGHRGAWRPTRWWKSSGASPICSANSSGAMRELELPLPGATRPHVGSAAFRVPTGPDWSRRPPGPGDQAVGRDRQLGDPHARARTAVP